MPRLPRVDYAGALHHVIGRGIERRFVFSSHDDKVFFLTKFTELCVRYGFRCYAWCIMDNHYHLLLETGDVPLAKLMSGLLTSYALFYNRSHRRVGHVFQNRYQSILCDKDSYLLELIRYIHLNPVKARMKEISNLDEYCWSGHRELVKRRELGLIDREVVLACFASTEYKAVRGYLVYLEAGLDVSRDFEGGGLKRSLGGRDVCLQLSQPSERMSYDQRILGDGQFVDKVLSQFNEQLDKPPRERLELSVLAQRVGRYYAVQAEMLFERHRASPYREARFVLMYLAVHYGNVSTHQALAGYFGVSRSAISMGVREGRRICKDGSLEPLLTY